MWLCAGRGALRVLGGLCWSLNRIGMGLSGKTLETHSQLGRDENWEFGTLLLPGCQGRSRLWWLWRLFYRWEMDFASQLQAGLHE